MKRIFTLFFLLFTITLIAQPTITSSWLPQFGDMNQSVVGLDANSLDPGAAGANASWDYSGVQQDPEVPVAGFEYADPSVSDFADLFPDANIAIVVAGVEPNTLPASFYKATNDSYELLGNALPMTSIVYSDPQVLMEMPFTFGDSFSDDFEAMLNATGIESFISGSVETTCDAYGTITTPNGTYSDVIRIKQVTNRVDSIALVPGSFSLTIQEIESYAWFKNTMSNAIASLTIISGESVIVTGGMTFNDIIPETKSFSWADMDPSSTEDVSSNFGLNVRSFGPNPLQDNLNVILESESGGDVKFEIISEVGQLVKTRTFQIINGSNNLNLNVSTMPRGKYLLRMTHEGNTKIVPIQKI